MADEEGKSGTKTGAPMSTAHTASVQLLNNYGEDIPLVGLVHMSGGAPWENIVWQNVPNGGYPPNNPLLGFTYKTGVGSPNDYWFLFFLRSNGQVVISDTPFFCNFEGSDAGQTGTIEIDDNHSFKVRPAVSSNCWKNINPVQSGNTSGSAQEASTVKQVGEPMITSHSGSVQFLNKWNQDLPLVLVAHMSGDLPWEAIAWQNVPQNGNPPNNPLLNFTFKTGVGSPNDYWYVLIMQADGQCYDSNVTFYCNFEGSDAGSTGQVSVLDSSGSLSFNVNPPVSSSCSKTMRAAC